MVLIRNADTTEFKINMQHHHASLQKLFFILFYTLITTEISHQVQFDFRMHLLLLILVFGLRVVCSGDLSSSCHHINIFNVHV